MTYRLSNDFHTLQVKRQQKQRLSESLVWPRLTKAGPRLELSCGSHTCHDDVVLTRIPPRSLPDLFFFRHNHEETLGAGLVEKHTREQTCELRQSPAVVVAEGGCAGKRTATATATTIGTAAQLLTLQMIYFEWGGTRHRGRRLRSIGSSSPLHLGRLFISTWEQTTHQHSLQTVRRSI